MNRIRLLAAGMLAAGLLAIAVLWLAESLDGQLRVQRNICRMRSSIWTMGNTTRPLSAARLS